MMQSTLDATREENHDLREENAKLWAVVEAVKSHLPDLDDLMEPIGGGNPYWHCRKCGVTNVQLNMGSNSRTHDSSCDEFADVRAAIATLACT